MNGRGRDVPTGPDRIILTQRQHQLVDALDALGLGFLYSDWARLLYVSGTLARMIGRPVEEILAMQDPYELFAAEDRDPIRALALARVTGRDTPDSITGRIVGAHGELVPIEFIIQSIPDTSGRSHVLAFAVDLSDERGSERVTELRALIRTFGEASMDPVAVLSAAGETIFMNGPATGLLRKVHPGTLHEPAELLAACGVVAPADVLRTARARGAASAESRVFAIPFTIEVMATPGAYVLWWRPSSARILSARRGGP